MPTWSTSCLMKDEVTPLASPAFVREHGPFEAAPTCKAICPAAQPAGALAHLVRGARAGLARTGGRLAVQRHRPDVRRAPPPAWAWPGAPQAGRALAGERHAGAPGLSDPRHVPSPHAHYLCWRTGMMDRWECAAFAEWLKKAREGDAASAAQGELTQCSSAGRPGPPSWATSASAHRSRISPSNARCRSRWPTGSCAPRRRSSARCAALSRPGSGCPAA
jgi:hypothetical protein